MGGMRKPLVIDQAALPPSMRDPAYVPAKGEGPRELVVTPLRQLLAERRVGKHVATDETREGVMHASAFGIELDVLAKAMGIERDVLDEVYSDELAIGRSLLMNDLQTNLYNIGCDKFHKDSVRASMYLLGKLGGEMYRDTNRFELSGRNGQAIQIDQRTQTIDPTLLSGDQRDALREILTSAMKLAALPEGERVIEGSFSREDAA